MANFTELEILSFERVAFAHSLVRTNYHYELSSEGYGIYGDTPEYGGVLEVGFVEQNPLSFSCADKTYYAEENSIFIIPPDAKLEIAALNKGLHCHTSAEFLIRAKKSETDNPVPTSKDRFVFPIIIPPSKNNADIIRQIRFIANSETAFTKKSFFKECRDFYGLIADLQELVLSTGGIDTVAPGNRRHCKKAKRYIAAHISENIRISDIAAEVGISKNYLTNIFSASEGLPLVEYINRTKLSYMTDLIRKYDYTIAEAGEQVGFSDPNYVSRIFQKYFHTTISEYKKRWSSNSKKG